MINYENGKKVSLLGLLGLAALGAVSLLLSLLNLVGIYLGSWIYTITGLGGMLCFLAAAGGYGIMWMANRNNVDLVTAGAIGVSLLISLFFGSGILGVFANCYLLMMAMRVKQQDDRMFKLLLCAFAFTVLTALFPVGVFISWGFPLFLARLIGVIYSAGYLVCDGLCFLAAKNEA